MNADEAVKTVGRPPEIFTVEEGQDYLLESEKSFEVERREQIIREQKQTLDERHEEHELRKRFIGNTFTLVVAVIFLSFFVTVCVGIGWLSLSDGVIITMLTTTTANVIGILLIAFNWLFPKR